MHHPVIPGVDAYVSVGRHPCGPVLSFVVVVVAFVVVVGATVVVAGGVDPQIQWLEGQ